MRPWRLARLESDERQAVHVVAQLGPLRHVQLEAELGVPVSHQLDPRVSLICRALRFAAPTSNSSGPSLVSTTSRE